jgi:hypothetical protein
MPGNRHALLSFSANPFRSRWNCCAGEPLMVERSPRAG